MKNMICLVIAIICLTCGPSISNDHNNDHYENANYKIVIPKLLQTVYYFDSYTREGRYISFKNKKQVK